MRIVIAARPPFNFHSTVRAHGWYQLAPWTWDEASQALSRVERLDDGRVVSSHFRGEGNDLAVESKESLTACQPRAVIFDMDGLMLDTEALAREAWFETMHRWGYALTDDVYLQVLGTTAARTRDIFREAFGPDIPIEAMYDHKQRYVDEAIAAGRVTVKPGLVELLDWLDRQQIPKAVASSTARAQVLKKLSAVNLAGRFDAIVGGDEVAHGKPAPDIFLEAARRLHVPPTNCIALEDSENGVRAAHAAGMRVIMVPDLKLPDDDIRALAHRVLPSLHEAQQALREMMACADD